MAIPVGYDRARPDYPSRVYEILTARCGLRPGAATLEIGPGNGLATRRLLALGADPLVAVEPDERLAAYLSEQLRAEGHVIDLRVEAFEEAELDGSSFDLVVSATAFHWLNQPVALTKVGRVLRPGRLAGELVERVRRLVRCGCVSRGDEALYGATWPSGCQCRWPAAVSA